MISKTLKLIRIGDSFFCLGRLSRGFMKSIGDFTDLVAGFCVHYGRCFWFLPKKIIKRRCTNNYYMTYFKESNLYYLIFLWDEIYKFILINTMVIKSITTSRNQPENHYNFLKWWKQKLIPRNHIRQKELRKIPWKGYCILR